MLRLAAVIVIFLMGDWIFFDGDAAVRPLASAVEAGADVLADLVFKLAS